MGASDASLNHGNKTMPAGSRHIRSCTPTALHRGVYEIVLAAQTVPGSPFRGRQLSVSFVRPDGTRTTVDGFYDGGSSFRARAYCDALGEWRWQSHSAIPGLDGRKGGFRVVASRLPGKLRKHPSDPHQMAYDDGTWFLHIGDTGYRYLNPTEPWWREYIDQAVQMGATKIRTWFCSGRHDVSGLFDGDRGCLALSYWQAMEERIVYALERYPSVVLQLVVYGEDSAELQRYQRGDGLSRAVARYAQARWSSFPNIYWCVSNDLDMGTLKQAVSAVGRDMSEREPWGTLITNHQKRSTGYAFVDEAWSDLVTLETLDEADGEAVGRYRDIADCPVILEEDRYETYRPPSHPRYWFRHHMWGNLFAGGHPTFGGIRTWEPYDGELCGVQGYFDAVRHGKIMGAAVDFVHIAEFFRSTRITLNGMAPWDAETGPAQTGCRCLRGNGNVVAYLANPAGTTVKTRAEGPGTPSATLCLSPGTYEQRWMDPSSGVWRDGEDVEGGMQTLVAPGGGDWVLALVDRGGTGG